MQTSILNHVDIFNTYFDKQRWMVNMNLHFFWHNYSVLLYPIQIQLCPINSHYHCITILSHALGVKPSLFTSHSTMIYPMQTKCSPIKTPSKLVIHHPNDLKPKEDGYNPCSLISGFPIQFFPHPCKWPSGNSYWKWPSITQWANVPHDSPIQISFEKRNERDHPQISGTKVPSASLR